MPFRNSYAKIMSDLFQRGPATDVAGPFHFLVFFGIFVTLLSGSQPIVGCINVHFVQMKGEDYD